MSTGSDQVTGISLTIGLNNVGPWYQGRAPRLRGCINDAQAIAQIASGQGFQNTTLTDGQATVEAVTNAILSAAARLKPGDIFLLHYSGHGMDAAPDGATADAQGFPSTSWCLFDEPLVNHDLYNLWFKFADSVRISVFSDSCHSGTGVRDVMAPIPRSIAPEDATELMAAHPDFARKAIARDAAPVARLPSAAVILMSGCQNPEVSGDLNTHGMFTQAVLDTWNGGSFSGDYRSFYNAAAAATKAASGGSQNPNLFPVGSPVAVANFMQDRPFTVD